MAAKGEFLLVLEDRRACGLVHRLRGQSDGQWEGFGLVLVGEEALAGLDADDLDAHFGHRGDALLVLRQREVIDRRVDDDIGLEGLADLGDRLLLAKPLAREHGQGEAALDHVLHQLLGEDFFLGRAPDEFAQRPVRDDVRLVVNDDHADLLAVEGVRGGLFLRAEDEVPGRAEDVAPGQDHRRRERTGQQQGTGPAWEQPPPPRSHGLILTLRQHPAGSAHGSLSRQVGLCHTGG